MNTRAKLTSDQREAVDQMLRQGYENSAQIAKLLGLTHEYVAEYVGGGQ